LIETADIIENFQFRLKDNKIEVSVQLHIPAPTE